MNMADRYGISRYTSLGEMPQKTLSAYRLISSTYADLMDMNKRAVDLQERAARQAGFR
jgi:hypothetical protein